MINDYILTQYSLKARLTKFGEGGQNATMKELQQMLAREVFGEANQNKLTYEQKKKALPVLLFLTLKRDGTMIKGRACAVGRPQRVWADKQDTASPTNIAVEALFYTRIMDALEERDVATCDVPGTFLQTSMEGVILLWISRALASL